MANKATHMSRPQSNLGLADRLPGSVRASGMARGYRRCRSMPTARCPVAGKFGSLMPGSVSEMPHTAEHHGYTALIRRVNYLLVAHRAAGLDDAGGASVHH